MATATNVEELVRGILATGDTAPSARERDRLMRMLREAHPDRVGPLQQQLVLLVDQLNRGLVEAQGGLAELMQLNERLTRPPWHLAVYHFALPDSQQAVVSHAGRLRVVGLDEGLDPAEFERGDDVFLSGDANLLVGRSPWGCSPVGETAEFVRFLDTHRAVIRYRDEEVVVDCAESLAGEVLAEGDVVRWQRETYLALEKVEREPSRRYFLDEVPDASPAQVGGQRSALTTLIASLTTVLVDPVKAAAYHLTARQSILLVGPPGCGKTLMARVAAAETMRISGKRCHFALVKPSEWEDPYVGGTQAKIRDCFESLRARAGRDEHVVLFMDEVESSGRTRGHLMGHHSDKFVAALLAELDGFAARGGVAIVAATNRKDMVDPSLLERISDVEIQVPRPDLAGAGEIFRVHLPETLPFSPNGSACAETRSELIDVAVARLFDPNCDNKLATVKMRDGTQHTVAARDLVSGRLIQQICRAACQRAFLRDMSLGDRGLRTGDIEEAVADAIDRLSTTLSLHNVRSYLPALPQDLDVVSVEPVVRRVKRAHRFLNHI